eukprot:CAMPEP_0113867236 /NCGR_PEP_ID=MMETSP0780_2-20120614/309_1 /TAXON_ID=652834 /ORGANISM="Palpitomonas bilix" /LENGTH=453 /DNA_ID=CAMNT_0000852161 /DNA_START=174 /DNA_END=1535 /DNA_ORIENTATION=+ /assembly_acc=CAM_ASM_000599
MEKGRDKKDESVWPKQLKAYVAKSSKHDQEDHYMETWRNHKKHFFILTSAGKPVYTRYGDESRLSDFFGIMIALSSFVEDSHAGDKLRFARAGRLSAVFLPRGALLYVAISRCREAVPVLARQLDYFHRLIVSTVSSRVYDILTRQPSYDVRNVLGGTSNTFRSLMCRLSYQPEAAFQAFSTLPLAPSHRDRIRDLLTGMKKESSSLVAAVILAEHKVVAVAQSREGITPEDLFTIVNFVNSSTSLRNSESSWTPRHDAFLHAFVSFYTPVVSITILTKDQRDVVALQEVGMRIKQEMSEGSPSLLDEVEKMHSTPLTPPTSVPGATHALHFMVLRDNQVVLSSFPQQLDSQKKVKKLLRRYQHIASVGRRFESVAGPVGLPKGGSRRPDMLWRVTSEFATLVHSTSTSEIEVFCTFPPTTSASDATLTAYAIEKWVKEHEDTLLTKKIATFY